MGRHRLNSDLSKNQRPWKHFKTPIIQNSVSVISQMANPHSKSLPLYEKIVLKKNTQRVFDIIIFFLLLSLLIHRLLSLSNVHGFSWLQTIAFLCESWFTFVWVLLITIKWNPVDYKTYPERLLKREVELPPVDIFVTTADPVLEPPIITVNTVVSLLAVDYPADKLACYVSDDGCSPLTFYSLSEAVKFAKIWVPFCKKYDVQVRAPFRFFLNEPPIESSGEFQKEWKTMKDEYEKLKGVIEEAERKTVPSRDLSGELAVFSHLDSGNHPTIIKILWENKECLSHELPHLIYISREKRSKHPHHYKAGAMNVLTRVSGILTNAPYMLNVDCDMFVNNPQVFQHAVCVLLDPKVDEEVGFVQFPQCFYDGLKDDPYGNQLIVLYEYINRGIVGLQGTFYSGTGCFHRRKVIYGHSPRDTGDIIIINNDSEQELLQSFGFSNPFVDSATIAFNANLGNYQKGLSNYLEAAHHVAGSDYEFCTIWGSKVGWIYGSKAEDIQTGLMIHRRGWRSIFVAPNPVAFLGCAPSAAPSSLTQQKRWVVGLLEVLFSKTSPIFGVMFGKLQLRQCVAYLWILTWGLRPVPEICYSALAAYCLITNSHFFPTVQESAVLIPISLFLLYNLQQLIQYYETGQSLRAWWNNQRMARVNTMCAWLFGFVTVTLKLLGLVETVFEVTKKETSSSSDNNGETDEDSGRFTFDESPMFVPGTTILFIQIIALLIGMSRLRPGSGGAGDGGLEAMCSVWLVLCFWPFFKGTFGKGRFGIPLSTIYKSAALALLFVHLCQRSG